MLDGVMYYTVSDIARYFEVGEPTVRQWVKRKHLVPRAERLRVGRARINIFSEDVVKTFAQRKYGYDA